MQTKAKEVMNTMLTNIVTIVKETPAKIWNSIVGAVLGLCYMGAAYMSQHYERTVETAVLGVTYVGNSYLANTF